MPDATATWAVIGPHAWVVSAPGAPVAMMTPDENVLPVVSTARRVSPGPAVNLYQTLLFVSGAPHSLVHLRVVRVGCRSRRVERGRMNGNAETTVAPLIKSLGGGVAADAVPTKPPRPNATATHAERRENSP